VFKAAIKLKPSRSIPLPLFSCSESSTAWSAAGMPWKEHPSRGDPVDSRSAGREPHGPGGRGRRALHGGGVWHPRRRCPTSSAGTGA